MHVSSFLLACRGACRCQQVKCNDTVVLVLSPKSVMFCNLLSMPDLFRPAQQADQHPPESLLIAQSTPLFFSFTGDY